jgi:hypothetical protein
MAMRLCADAVAVAGRSRFLSRDHENPLPSAWRQWNSATRPEGGAFASCRPEEHPTASGPRIVPHRNLERSSHSGRGTGWFGGCVPLVDRSDPSRARAAKYKSRLLAQTIGRACRLLTARLLAQWHTTFAVNFLRFRLVLGRGALEVFQEPACCSVSAECCVVPEWPGYHPLGASNPVPMREPSGETS